MSTVINLVKISLLIFISLTYLFGLGYLILKLLLGKILVNALNDRLFQRTSLYMMIGLLINYLLLLIIQDIKVAIFIGILISIIGLSLFSIQSFKSRRNTQFKWAVFWNLIGIFVIIILFFSPIMAVPLIDWDARSIWFFHAKMIYSAGSINNTAGWSSPIDAFSHPDYPKLVPALAAQLSYIVGFWNEYLPKLALLLMFLPPLMSIISFRKWSLSYIFLLFMMSFNFSLWTWNGYMDGLLAIYTSISILFLGRYFQKMQNIDFISSVVCVLLLINIKNEGILVAVAISFVVFQFFSNNWKTTKVTFKNFRKFFLFGITLLLPFLIWNVYKIQWGLHNDLGIGTVESFQFILSRLKDGSMLQIFSQTFGQIYGLIFLIGFLLIALAIRQKTITKEVFFGLIVASIIFLGIITVYSLTPHDLIWHLGRSVDRTMLPVNGGLIIAGYFILHKIES